MDGWLNRLLRTHHDRNASTGHPLTRDAGHCQPLRMRLRGLVARLSSTTSLAMEVFEKSETVDPEVRAYVYSLVSAVGFIITAYYATLLIKRPDRRKQQSRRWSLCAW